MAISVLPSCLTMVNNVLREIAIPEVSSLDPGTIESRIVLEGINDAVADIWNRGRWEFQRYTYALNLVAGQDEYAVPSDFGRISLPFRLPGSRSSFEIQETTPEEFYTMGLNSDFTSSQGQPRLFYVEHLTIKFWPVPNQEFIDQVPQIQFGYFKKSPARRGITDDNNSWDLPLDFYDALMRFGKGRIKEYLQYDDAQMNYNQYEQALAVQEAKYRQGRVTPTMRPRYAVISEW
jgi:hypothetical protein